MTRMVIHSITLDWWHRFLLYLSQFSIQTSLCVDDSRRTIHSGTFWTRMNSGSKEVSLAIQNTILIRDKDELSSLLIPASLSPSTRRPTDKHGNKRVSFNLLG